MIRTKALWLAALLVLAVVAGSSAAFSYPSLQGPTGLVMLPDANVEPRGSFTLAADYVNMDADARPEGGEAHYPYGYVPVWDITSGWDDLKIIPTRLVWGVSDKAELWAAFTDINNSDRTTEWAFGAKLQVHNDPATGVKVAVGAGYRDATYPSCGGSCHHLTSENVYAVLTKETRAQNPHHWRWKGSMGMDYTKLEPGPADWASAYTDTILQPFVGLEASSGRLSLVGEYRLRDAKIDDASLWSAAVRYKIGRRFAVEAGVTNGALFGVAAHKTSAFYGLAYTFGGHRGKVEEAGY